MGDVGPVIWTRRDVFPWNGVTYDQREVFFCVRLDAEVDPAPTADAADMLEILDQRWWTIDDLEGHVTAPRRLRELLRTLVDDGPPSEPIDVGV